LGRSCILWHNICNSRQ